MKRNVKNIIMIGMAIVMIGTSAITCRYAETQSRGFNSPPSFSQSENGSRQFTPPQGGFPGGSQNGNSNQQPPEFPGNGNSSEMPELPDGNNNAQSQDNSEEKSENNSSSNTSVETAQSSGEMNSMRAMPSMKKQSNVLSILCYAFMAVQLAILLMIIAYLIVSKFNKLSYNQVFGANKKE